MTEFYKTFLRTLRAGFIDQSRAHKPEFLPEMLINDPTSGKKVLSSILHELTTCREFWFSVAFASKSGVAALMNTLSELAARQIPGKILVSQYLNFTQPEALRALRQFSNIDLKIAVNNDFHSKGYLFKHETIDNLIIGSTNLTATAMCTNIEWNLRISGFAKSHIMLAAHREFQNSFEQATPVTEDFIEKYTQLYQRQFIDRRSMEKNVQTIFNTEFRPNIMQEQALENLRKLRESGKQRALIVSATGTGKTFLSAFDAAMVKPRRLLFVVHRLNIAQAAARTFDAIFKGTKSIGLFSGEKREIDKDFIFATIQTVSREDQLRQFQPNEFDYIVIDETHRATAKSYETILGYFQPKFILGMTATPERTDGVDVFKLFDYNIAYEIRLHKALEQQMLVPFHYFGVTDISVGGEILSDHADFTLLSAPERIDRIAEKIRFYRTDDGVIRGLMFASSIQEAKILAEGLNARGFKAIALTGESTEKERSDAIENLESEEDKNRIEIIVTVDIFNEGIDIPKVNLVVMLRPTQSAIIFVQQLGRGLRKSDNKDHLTVLDFIGNYSNNYLVPIALYGDRSYNKDTLRRMLNSGSALIPGASTVNFEKIAKEKIYKAIDSANMQLKVDLVKDYDLLKFTLGRPPMMVDFINHGARDPQSYVSYSGSFYNFAKDRSPDSIPDISQKSMQLLEFCASGINNGKRIEESIILQSIITVGHITRKGLRETIYKEFAYEPTDETIQSSISNLNLEFVRQNRDGKMVPVREVYGFTIISEKNDVIVATSDFLEMISDNTVRDYLADNVNASILKYSADYQRSRFCQGFVLYRKYSRKDVFRILNWAQNPVAQNVGGYIVSPDKSNCPIFVTYNKAEHISETTKYKEGFLNPTTFEWMSKSKRTLNSPEIVLFRDPASKVRLPFFVQKSNDEGTEFYYLGDATPVPTSFRQTTLAGKSDSSVSVVSLQLTLSHPVEENLYQYLID